MMAANDGAATDPPARPRPRRRGASLRARLLAYGVLVAAASLSVLVAVFLRGTHLEVREYTRSIVHSGPGAVGPDATAVAEVENLLRGARRQPVRDPERPPLQREDSLDDLLARLAAEAGRDLLVVDPRGAILGAARAPAPGPPSATGAGAITANGVAPTIEPLADGGFRITRRDPGGQVADELVLRAPGGTLRGRDGAVLGTLLVLPPGPALEADLGPPPRPERSPAAILSAFRRWLLLATLAAAAVAIPLGLLVAKRMTRPVESLTAAAHRLRAGSLSQRVPVEGADEIADLAQAFNAMAEDLERVEASRQRLVADVAHELRTPLSRLRAQLEALGDGLLPFDREATRVLETDVLLLARLVDDLQDLALADAERLRLLRVEVDLAPFVERLAAAHEGAARRAGVEIAVVAEAGLEIRADPARLEQIAGNLLANALTWAPAPGGRIALRARRARRNERAGVELIVEDNGPGVAAEHLPHLFDRFYRVDPARPRDGKGGAGLGLAVVQALARAHGGEATAESPPEGGARFTVFLPREEPADKLLTIAP